MLPGNGVVFAQQLEYGDASLPGSVVVVTSVFADNVDEGAQRAVVLARACLACGPDVRLAYGSLRQRVG